MTRSTPSRHSVVLTATTRRKSVRIQQRGIDIVALPRLTAYHRRQLARATLDNTPAFAIPQTPVWARIVDVYDGDSLTAAFKLHGRMYSWTVRVFGIDTPELKISTLFPASERERKRALGYEVADYVRSLLLGNTVCLCPRGRGKYGRLLCTVQFTHEGRETDLRDHLVSRGMARVYMGGKKMPW